MNSKNQVVPISNPKYQGRKQTKRKLSITKKGNKK